jgi:hypothetical protein
MDADLWTFRTKLDDTVDLDGFEVHASDGDIGHVDEATYEVGASYIVVDTGPWIFGKKVLIPARNIESVNLDAREVWLGLTKDQIKDSPEFDEAIYRDPDYRSRVGEYYGPLD